jgi:hypothetical protein
MHCCVHRDPNGLRAVRHSYYGKPSAEQFHIGRGPDNQNSTSTVGAGLEFQKTTSHTDDTIQKIKWRGAVSSIQHNF